MPARIRAPLKKETRRQAESLRNAGRARSYQVWGVCGFLLLVVALVFGQTLGHDFTGGDDEGFVSKNPHVTAGLTLAGMRWALTDGPYGEWYPLTALSHMLDCQLYGLNPAGHYLTNVLLHAASVVLLFLVLLRMTDALWPCAWVAAVFAIHPLHVESVAWIAERRDVLSGMFFMLTLLAYACYAERRSLTGYLAVAGCFALGLMAKPMLVTVPCVLLLLDYWPLGPAGRSAGAPLQAVPLWRLVVEKIPLMVLAATSCVIQFSTHTASGMNSTDLRLPLGKRLANAVISYAAYVGQSFYPVGLSPYYPFPSHLPSSSVAAAVVLLLAITALAAFFWRRLPYLIVGWLWFLGMLVPVIGLVQFAAHARADRYLYLSQIGLSIAVAWSVREFYQWRQSRQPARWRRWLLTIGSASSIAILAVVAARQTTYWQNPETLWSRAAACDARNLVAQRNLALFCYHEGRIEDALAHLRQGVASDSIAVSMIAECHVFLADLLTGQGKDDEALTHYEEAARIFPQSAKCHAWLGAALARAGQFGQAVTQWRETARLDSTSFYARWGLADALLANGETTEAIAVCRELLTQQHESVQTIVTLAAALAAQGQTEESLDYFARALRLDSSDADAHFRLGLALQNSGQSKLGIIQLDEALRLQPDSIPILTGTAWILATCADPSVRNGARAVELATKATRLSHSQDPGALDALAAALAESAQFTAATDAAEQAAAIAQRRGAEALAQAIQSRLALYRQNSPFHETPQHESTPAAEKSPSDAAR
jgi:protein O-mannosyl-transferase